jgi:hypothetical protein
MKSYAGSLFLLVLGLLAVAPALADDDDDRHERRHEDDHREEGRQQVAPGQGGFLGVVFSIRTNRYIPPFGSLPLPANTSRVFLLGGNQVIIVPVGTPVVGLNRGGIGATLSGIGTPRADGSVIASRIAFTPVGAVGFITNRVGLINAATDPVPLGLLPNPLGTQRIFTLSNGERVIVTVDTLVVNPTRAVVGATLSGEGVPRLDGTIIATRIRFD